MEEKDAIPWEVDRNLNRHNCHRSLPPRIKLLLPSNVGEDRWRSGANRQTTSRVRDMLAENPRHTGHVRHCSIQSEQSGDYGSGVSRYSSSGGRGDEEQEKDKHSRKAEVALLVTDLASTDIQSHEDRDVRQNHRTKSEHPLAVGTLSQAPPDPHQRANRENRQRRQRNPRQHGRKRA